MIELKNVRVEFPSGQSKAPAVDGVSLAVREGEVLGIVGSSGAGKSTLVRTINLLQAPTAGEVIVDGVSIVGQKGRQLRETRAGIGMIFQLFNLWNAKTVGQNVAFPLKQAGWSKRQTDERVDEVLRFVNLLDKKDVYPRTLSGGQKQRVAIARALAPSSRILLCDEPTSALDLETTASVLDVLRRANEELGVTMVVITHELDVVKRICHRVAVMGKGRIVEHGNTFDVLSNPQSEVAKGLVEQTQRFDLPEEVLQQSGALFKLTYAGPAATEPVLFEAGSSFDVTISIVHGRIEYLAQQPYGILYVLVNGEPAEIEKVAAHLRARVERLEVVRHAG